MVQERIRILLLDDEASLRIPLQKFLEDEYGCQVDAASDSDEAIELVRQNEGGYDVALLDEVLVKGWDGIQVLEWIKTNYPDMEAIVFTAWGAKSKHRALQAGAYRYLEKPFDTDELALTVRTAAQQVRLREIGRAILAERDRERMLQAIIEAACSLSFADEAALLLTDAAGGVEIYPQLPRSGPRWTRHFKESKLASEIVRTGRAVTVSDTQADPRVAPAVIEAGVRSLLGVRIPGQQQNQGALFVYSRQPNRFEQGGIVAVLQTLAGQAGVAIANAEAFGRLEQHGRHMAALVEASQESAGTQELVQQLERVWRFVRQQFGSETFLVGLYDQESDTLRFPLVYDKGKRGEIPDRVLGDAPERWGLAGYVARTGRELMWADQHEAQQRQEELGLTPILIGDACVSCLFVPLRSGRELLGAISLQSYRPGAFDPIVLNVFRALAGQVAVLVKNTQLIDGMRRAVEEQNALIESAFDAVVAIGEDRKVRVFNRQAEKLFGRTAQEMLGRTASRLYADPARGREIFTVVERDGAVSEWDAELKQSDGVTFPGLVSGRVIRDSDGRSIGQAGFMRDLRQTRLAQDRLHALIQAAGYIKSTLDQKQVLKLVVEAARQAFPSAERGSIHLYNNRTELLELMTSSTVYPDDAREAASFRPGDGVAGWVFAHDEPVALDDAREDSRYRPIPNRNVPLHRSMICVPLRLREQIIGVLTLSNTQAAGLFDPSDLSLAATFADQAASAIENARLYQEADRHRQLLMALDMASRHIRAEKETEKLLKEVVRLAAGLLNCPVGGLCENHPRVGSMNLSVSYGLPDDLLGCDLPHVSSVLGQVGASGQAAVVNEYADDAERRASLAAHGVRAVVAVPLKQAGEVEAVLFVGDRGERRFETADQEILERFAAQASIALHTSRLMGTEKRALGQIVLLHRVGDYVQAAGDLDRILHAVLTAATAGYGLGLNRAALLLIDEAGQKLVGQLGIGHLERAEAQKDWNRHHENGLEDFGRYLKELEQGRLRLTPVGERMAGLPLEIGGDDPLARAVRERHMQQLAADELAQLPAAFVRAFEPAAPLVLVPLVSGEAVIGLLVADNKFTQAPITPQDLESLLTLANTAAVAIDNARFQRQVVAARERLRSLYQASNALVSSQDPEAVLHEVVEQIRAATDALWVSVIMIDEGGHAYNLTRAGEGGSDSEIEKIVRPDGISMQVMATGRPALIDDTGATHLPINPRLIESGVGAAACIPLSLYETRIGVMWIHYRGAQSFPQEEVEAFQLFANQAAIAYQNARRIRELEEMRHAAEVLTGTGDLREVLQQIASSAQRVLGALSAAVWSFDATQGRFIEDQAAAAGLTPAVWEALGRQVIAPGSTAAEVIKNGWRAMEDLNLEDVQGFLTEPGRQLLLEVGAQSVESIPLTAGEEKLGVLLVSFGRPRSFGDQDRETLMTFANHAALALKKARLLEQVQRAIRDSELVARLMALGDAPATLESVVEGTRTALNCDAVTLFVYNQETAKLDHPPTMTGVRYPNLAMRFKEVERSSVVYDMLERDEPYFVENSHEDPHFSGRRFTVDEGIRSAMAIPLVAQGQKVGVMFVNYRTPHRFSTDDKDNSQLFADQAAVAIRNAQLYQAERQHGRALEIIQETSAAVNAELSAADLLPLIAERAARIFDAPATSVMLWDEKQENLVIHAAVGLGRGYVERQRIPRARVDALRATISARPHVFGIHDEPLGTPELIREENLKNVLAVPLLVSGELIGVLNVYSKGEARPFTGREKEMGEILANHTAISIRNARLYREATERLEESQTLERVMRSLAGTLGLDEVLRLMMVEATRLTETEAGSILLWDAEQESFGRTLTIDGASETLRIYSSRVRQTGGTARHILESQELVVVEDARRNTGVSQIALEKGRIAYIGVPLVCREQSIGVLYVSSPTPRPFSERQVALLSSLASQAAVAVERARQYEELRKTKGMVGASTALAWMGMANSAWRHSIEGHAINIRNAAALLEQSLAEDSPLHDKLGLIQRLATEILIKPITPPLSSEEGIETIAVNDLVSERIDQLWQYETYAGVEVEVELGESADAMVQISPEWFRRALDLLVDNAVEAMSESERPRLEIRSKLTPAGVELAIRDTGRGIPAELLPRLFVARIERSPEHDGMGMGLLMVQAILQTYGGDIRVGDTGPSGTSMLITLPLAG